MLVNPGALECGQKLVYLLPSGRKHRGSAKIKRYETQLKYLRAPIVIIRWFFLSCLSKLRKISGYNINVMMFASGKHSLSGGMYPPKSLAQCSDISTASFSRAGLLHRNFWTTRLRDADYCTAHEYGNTPPPPVTAFFFPL